jgi:hypothetical protein
LLQTSADPTKRIYLERIETRVSGKRAASGEKKRQMEFVDIASLHAHVHTPLPRQQHPVQALAMLIALTGCDFCNSLPAIGPAKLWAARHRFRNVDVSAEGPALCFATNAISPNQFESFVRGCRCNLTPCGTNDAKGCFKWGSVQTQTKEAAAKVAKKRKAKGRRNASFVSKGVTKVNKETVFE